MTQLVSTTGTDRVNLYVNGVFLGNFIKGKDGIDRYIKVCLSRTARVIKNDVANVFIADEETSFE